MLILSIPISTVYCLHVEDFTWDHRFDALELRLDFWLGDLSTLVNLLKILKKAWGKPIILVVLRRADGGLYRGCEQERRQFILAVCAANPEYLEVEWDQDVSWVQHIGECYPKMLFMGAYYESQNNESTIQNQYNKNIKSLENTQTHWHAAFQSLQSMKCAGYKFVTRTPHILNALNLLCFTQGLAKDHLIGAYGIGQQGSCTRILRPVVGQKLHYFNQDHEAEEGHLPLETLESVYNFSELERPKKIYALLGHPIHKSPGHIFHNQAFKSLNNHSIYVKLSVTVEALPLVIPLCKKLPFSGFSVTMPLKEAIIPHLDHVDEGARHAASVNTVVVKAPGSLGEEAQWHGYTTDGLGVIAALEKHFKTPIGARHTFFILGAGGAARSLVSQAVPCGAQVVIFNRTLGTAQQWAEAFKCEALPLGAFYKHFEQQQAFDHKVKKNICIVVNTLPIGCDLSQMSQFHQTAQGNSVQKCVLLPNAHPSTVVVECNHDPQSSWLKWAEQQGCGFVTGYDMYTEQALLQLKLWKEFKETGSKKSNMASRQLWRTKIGVPDGDRTRE